MTAAGDAGPNTQALVSTVTRMTGGRNLAADAIDHIAERRSAQAKPAYDAGMPPPCRPRPRWPTF